MDRLKRIMAALAFFAMGTAFSGLVAYSLSTGVAAAKLGAASRVQSPALFWFMLGGQLVWGLLSFGWAAQVLGLKLPVRNLAIAILGATILLGGWVAVESAIAMVRLALAEGDLGRRLFILGAGAAVIGVLLTLLYTLVFSELIDRFKGRGGRRK